MVSNTLKQAQVLRLVLQYCHSCSSSGATAAAALVPTGVLPCTPAASTLHARSNVLHLRHPQHTRCNHTAAQTASSSSSETKQQHRGAPKEFEPYQALDGGRYKLMRLIRDLPSPIQGRQATLWQGRDLLLNRDVELQCLEAGDAGSYSAGMREAALHAASGRCPNIVPLLDAFEHRSSSGRHPVMVFEQTGDTLVDMLEHYCAVVDISNDDAPANHVKGIREEPKALKAIARDLLEGLNYLHQRSVVHMLVEPQNVVLDRRFISYTQTRTLVSSALDAAKLQYLRNRVRWSKTREAKHDLLVEWAKHAFQQAERDDIRTELNLALATFRLTNLSQAVCLKGTLPYQPAGQPSEQLRAMLEQPPHLYNADGGVFSAGDPTYRPPEEVLGMVDCIAPAYDMWKLGCLLFEAATGRKLFTADLRQAHLRGIKTDYGYGDDHYLLNSMVRVLGNIPRGYGRRSPRRAEFFYQSTNRTDASADMLAIHAGPLDANAGEESILLQLREHTGLHSTLEGQGAALRLVDQATPFADFLSEMLRWEPTSRATPAKLLQHPWLSS